MAIETQFGRFLDQDELLGKTMAFVAGHAGFGRRLMGFFLFESVFYILVAVRAAFSFGRCGLGYAAGQKKSRRAFLFQNQRGRC